MGRSLPLALLLLLAASAATAGGGGKLGKLVGEVVRGRYGELHRCYRKALAIDRSKGGTIFLKVTLGAGDRVSEAKVARDELGQRAVTRCLESAVGRWRFPGAAAAGAVSGSELYLPLTFRADPSQQAVAAADLGWPPRYDGKVALLTAKNSGALGVSVELLRARAAQESDASRARLLVLLEGKARLGKRRRGGPSALLLPAGSHAELEPHKRVTLLSLTLPVKRASGTKPRLWGLGPRWRTFAPGLAVRVVALKAGATLRQRDLRARRVLYLVGGRARLGGASSATTSKPGAAKAAGRRLGRDTGVFWSKRGAATLTAERPTRLIEIRLP